LTDFPETTIATDNVDKNLIDRPRRWDIAFIRKFMLVFGPLSSVFDYLTFGVLLLMLHAGVVEFRTGWFIESVVSASLIVLVVRTRQPFFKSIPGKYLTATTFIVIAATIILPFTSVGRLFSFKPLPPIFMLALGIILVLYIAGAELTKKLFYRLVRF
jgi:Mg2+-importing ATPase